MSLRPDKEPLSAALCSLQLLCAFLKVGREAWGVALLREVCGLSRPPCVVAKATLCGSLLPLLSVPCAWREDTAH